MITVTRMCRSCGRKFTFTWKHWQSGLKLRMPEICGSCLFDEADGCPND